MKGNGELYDGDADAAETKDWLDALGGVLLTQGQDRARYLISQLKAKAARNGVDVFTVHTPYVNTIPPERQAPFPGNRDLERRIKSVLRWNAMAMVVRANKRSGVGGHISTYASLATLYEVGFNHFFRGPEAPGGGDFIYFQGHSTPGIYARSFLEGRLPEARLENFRRELDKNGGLTSYPHPWLMPDYWQFPTVSMGLGPLMAIYHARFLRYMEHRGLRDTSQNRVWAFIGDGECDEPETLGSLTLASREKLDNLIFVINCNLQRLDGPVRGNFKIIQELEAAFRGGGWNVLKVIWGTPWDDLLARDRTGLLVKRMNETVDGEYQRYSTESGDYIREHFFGKYPELLKLVEHLSDEQLTKLSRGGHDPVKVYNAYKAAVEHKGGPTVILAKTVKGYGLGEAGEALNIAHQAKKMVGEHRIVFRDRFNLPLTNGQASDAVFYKPADDSPEVRYLHERRKALGGHLPARKVNCPALPAPPDSLIEPFFKGSDGRPVSTTMVFVDLLKRLLQSQELGKYIVPIIPDEARTFGMEGMFPRYGIYSNVGQLYEPVDYDTMTRYREAKDGQIIEEGITEAGSMSSFIAAGTAYANLGVPMIPFYIYYSMFGFQRVGDLIWAAADMRTRGFLLGGTAGRTTLEGEGLQHQDGHSHLAAATIPNMRNYDPAFAFEVALIIQDGIRRMYEKGENIFYYLTLGNENYPMAPLPSPLALGGRGVGGEGDVRDGVLRGMYKFKSSELVKTNAVTKVHLLGSGSILREALRAQEILAEKYAVAADVWSVTSYRELRREALACERWNRLHPASPPRKSYLETVLENEKGVFLAVSDYMKLNQEMIARWVPGGLCALGADGFGRSDGRQALRRFFEVDAECICVAALEQLLRRGELKPAIVEKAIKDLGVDPEKPDPVNV
ncbi:MAG: pyruvate dehydrogenase (acetyl-transferring), homodimeric type [Gemmataceae bacterium]|nr:pyruvate dehydrogenase (acetyl-transferring), homodimeric type [Gemmataceae bacterium]MCI0737795.1 pyruvate dehydrogenase (acetyl-transferring), homodimeric type [Gemmataceae bacterium]